MKTKICTKCNKEKGLLKFSLGRNQCKECMTKYYKEYCKLLKIKNPEKIILRYINHRCNDLNNKYYALKGIKNFLNEENIRFLMIRDDYWKLKRPSIERKNSKGDYILENCEFIDRGENTARRNREHCSKSILQYDLEGNFIKEWISLREVERKLNIPRSSISRCAKGSRNSSGGYKWKYKLEI